MAHTAEDAPGVFAECLSADSLRGREDLLGMHPNLRISLALGGQEPAQVLHPDAQKVLRFMLDPANSGLQAPTCMGQWWEGWREWQRGLDMLDTIRTFKPCPFPFKPQVDWVMEAGLLSPLLVREHYEDLHRTLEYGKPDSNLHAEPLHGLHRWASTAAAERWPANSLVGVDPGAIISEFATRPAHVLGHEPVAWHTLLPSPFRVEEFPWWTPSRGSGVVLAGGAVASMLNPGTQPGDFDLFVVVPSSTAGTPAARQQMARDLVMEAMQAMRGVPSSMTLYSYAHSRPNSNVINFYMLKCPLMSMEVLDEGGDMVFLKVQIILQLYESPAQIVHAFDLDACALLYDGDDVYATGRCLRAFHTGLLVVDPLHQSPSYGHRLVKYCKRYGLRILVPGLSAEWRTQTAKAIQKVLRSAGGLQWLLYQSCARQLHQQGGIQEAGSDADSKAGSEASSEAGSEADGPQDMEKELRSCWQQIISASIDKLARDHQPEYGATPRPWEHNRTYQADDYVRVCDPYIPARYLKLWPKYNPVDKLHRLVSRLSFRVCGAELNGVLMSLGSFSARPLTDWYQDAITVLTTINTVGTAPYEDAVLKEGLLQCDKEMAGKKQRKAPDADKRTTRIPWWLKHVALSGLVAAGALVGLRHYRATAKGKGKE